MTRISFESNQYLGEYKEGYMANEPWEWTEADLKRLVDDRGDGKSHPGV